MDTGTFRAVQWLRLWASTAVGEGSVSGQGTKIPYATWCVQKKKIKIQIIIIINKRYR